MRFDLLRNTVLQVFQVLRYLLIKSGKGLGGYNTSLERLFVEV